MPLNHQTETLNPMRERIANEIDAIERIHHVRILYACESGSRAWGFASQDSDYDVRFIYMHDTAWYLRLGETRDVIEWALDEVLDINGWDLSKALRLMRASNPTVVEWLNSPIVYRERDEFTSVRNLVDSAFSPRPIIYHYLNMARKNQATHLSADRVRLKKYFYVMRSLLSARWVAHRLSAPPIPFHELLDAELEPAMLPLFRDLIQQKATSVEHEPIPRIKKLDDWINATRAEIEDAIEDIPSRDKPAWDAFDAAFLGILNA